MQEYRHLRLVLLFQVIFIFLWGCSEMQRDANDTPATTSDDIQNTDNPGAIGNPNGGSPTIPANGGNPPAGGNAATENIAGSEASDSSPETGQNLPGGNSGGSGENGGDSKDSSGGETIIAGTGSQTIDSGVPNTTPVEADIPEPVTKPFMWGVGIGITDVEAAVKFYTEVMKMTVEKEVTRDQGEPNERTETVLYASEAERGARLVLMNFKDKRNTQKITTKLVWQASNASRVALEAASHPGYVSRMNMGMIVQFDGPETYIQEVGNIFDPGGVGISVPYLVAMGFSVSNLPSSIGFYTSAFGMTDTATGSYLVTDATGPANITEYTVKYPDGAGLVVQGWSPPRNSKDNPVKIVLFVSDAQANADKIVAAGGSIVQEGHRTEVYDNRLLIVTKDPDGYVIELVQ